MADDDRLGLVRFTRGLGRKRIRISPSLDSSPVKKPKTETTDSNSNTSSSLLEEALHQDILIKLLCHVDHEDLTSLKCVSKTIKKAVIEAESLHFDKCTPKKKLPFRDPFVMVNEDDEIEPPNAPIRRRFKNRQTDLSKISMVLFK